MRRVQGFTLIELLVVIAIIGILSAVVLTSLSGAKSKGNDTGVRAEVGTIATQAVLYYGLANTYGASNIGGTATCGSANGVTVFDDPNTTVDSPIINSIVDLQKDGYGGAVNKLTNTVCRSDDQRFLIMGELSNTHWFCADYTASTTFSGGVELTTKPTGLICQ